MIPWNFHQSGLRCPSWRVASGISEAVRAFQWENPWGIIENPWEKTWENHGKKHGKIIEGS